MRYMSQKLMYQIWYRGHYRVNSIWNDIRRWSFKNKKTGSLRNESKCKHELTYCLSYFFCCCPTLMIEFGYLCLSYQHQRKLHYLPSGRSCCQLCSKQQSRVFCLWRDMKATAGTEKTSKDRVMRWQNDQACLIYNWNRSDPHKVEQYSNETLLMCVQEAPVLWNNPHPISIVEHFSCV